MIRKLTLAILSAPLVFGCSTSDNSAPEDTQMEMATPRSVDRNAAVNTLCSSNPGGGPPTEINMKVTVTSRTDATLENVDQDLDDDGDGQVDADDKNVGVESICNGGPLTRIIFTLEVASGLGLHCEFTEDFGNDPARPRRDMPVKVTAIGNSPPPYDRPVTFPVNTLLGNGKIRLHDVNRKDRTRTPSNDDYNYEIEVTCDGVADPITIDPSIRNRSRR